MKEMLVQLKIRYVHDKVIKISFLSLIFIGNKPKKKFQIRMNNKI